MRPIINLSVQDALRMHFYEMNTDERALFLWSSFCLSIVCLTGIVLLLWIFSSIATEFLTFPEDWLIAVPFAAFLYASFYFLLAYFQFSENRLRFLLLHLFQTSASLAIIALLVWHSQGWQAVIAGKLVGLVLAVVVGAYWLSKGVNFSREILQNPQLALSLIHI